MSRVGAAVLEAPRLSQQSNHSARRLNLTPDARGRLHAAVSRMFVLGVDWRTGDGSWVGRAAKRAEALQHRINDLVTSGELQEALVVSTCNRFEIVAVPGRGSDRPSGFLEEVLARELLGPTDPVRVARLQRGVVALRHVFRTAAGLESALLGERDVRGQLRSSLQCSIDTGWGGPSLVQIVEGALGAAKRAHAVTPVGTGHSSLAEVASLEVLSHLDTQVGAGSHRRVLLVGAGDMIDKCARRLRRDRVDLWFVNRTREKAVDLARRHGGVVARWPVEAWTAVDAVVTATSAPGAILGAHELRCSSAAVAGPREQRLIVDLGMPADVDARAAEANGWRYVGLSELIRVTDSTRVERRSAAESAGRVIDEEVSRFCKRARRSRAEPWVSALQRQYRDSAMVALAELDSILAAGVEEAAMESRASALESWASRLARRLAHEPSRALRFLAEADLLDDYGPQNFEIESQERRHVE